MADRFLKIVNGVQRMVDATALPTIYDQTYTVGGGGISSGTPVTLPSAQTYDSAELEVYLNGQRLSVTADYNYVGSGARTQVSFTQDLVQNDVIKFRITRGV